MTHEFDEQREGEHLRTLRAEIESLLHEYDVCAVVFLAGRQGRFEHFNRVDATWSNLRYHEPLAGPPSIGLQSKASEYRDDPARQLRELEWSAGVVSGLAHLMTNIGILWSRAAQVMDARTGAKHTPFRREDPRDEGGAS